jgi:predicted PurR-regulated permease PerM
MSEVPNVQIGQWIGILALGIGLYILWQIRNVLMLIFAAVVIATALNTLAEKIQGWIKVKRSAAISLSIALLLGILALAIWLIVPPFADQFQQLTTASATPPPRPLPPTSPTSKASSPNSRNNFNPSPIVSSAAPSQLYPAPSAASSTSFWY